MNIRGALITAFFFFAFNGCFVSDEIPFDKNVTVYNHTASSVTIYYAEEVSGPDVEQRSALINTGSSTVIQLQRDAFPRGPVTARYGDSFSTYDVDYQDTSASEISIQTTDFE